jgi:hypothetical protein
VSHPSTLSINPLGESASVFSGLVRELTPDVSEAAKRLMAFNAADD